MPVRAADGKCQIRATARRPYAIVASFCEVLAEAEAPEFVNGRASSGVPASRITPGLSVIPEKVEYVSRLSRAADHTLVDACLALFHSNEFPFVDEFLEHR